MSVDFVGPVPNDVQSAIEQVVSPHLSGTPDELLVFHGTAAIDSARARTALDGGATIAIVDARAGQLADVDPGTGCDVSTDVALFAVRRIPVPEHAGRSHTVVTMLADPATTNAQAVATDDTGQEVVKDQSQPVVSADTIAEELKRHLVGEVVLDTSLIPPTGAFYGTITYNCVWNVTITQNLWSEASGNRQTAASRTTLTYYVYFANGAGQAPQYVVLLIESGTVSPAAGGTSGLCSYDNGERAFALGTNTLSNAVLSGALSLVAQSPSATTSTPVTDSIDYQMTVMADQGGGPVSTPFAATITTQTDNPDWGVAQAGNPAANEAAWMYYNITGWNASTQIPQNFGQWWGQMYGDGDSVITLDSQCLNGASFHAVAAWTIPQNPGNAAPLNVQLQYQNTLLLEGFVNCDNSGNGHHQIGWCTSWGTLTTPVWDLVAFTGSKPDEVVP